RALTYRAEDRPLVEVASFRLEPGGRTMLIGTNGSGKSTLLRLALGLLAPDAGEALIDGANVRGLSPTARARKAAYLPQTRPLAWPMPVRDVIALGRFAYGAAPGRLSAKDAAAVARAHDASRLAGCSGRPPAMLSRRATPRHPFTPALMVSTP